MGTLDRTTSKLGRRVLPDAERTHEAAALWSAIAADRRARDERTARLRAMRLIAGDDAVV